MGGDGRWEGVKMKGWVLCEVEMGVWDVEMVERGGVLLGGKLGGVWMIVYGLVGFIGGGVLGCF